MLQGITKRFKPHTRWNSTIQDNLQEMEEAQEKTNNNPEAAFSDLNTVQKKGLLRAMVATLTHKHGINMKQGFGAWAEAMGTEIWPMAEGIPEHALSEPVEHYYSDTGLCDVRSEPPYPTNGITSMRVQDCCKLYDILVSAEVLDWKKVLEQFEAQGNASPIMPRALILAHLRQQKKSRGSGAEGECHELPATEAIVTELVGAEVGTVPSDNAYVEGTADDSSVGEGVFDICSC